MVKLMEAEERHEVVEALFHWFDSQGINSIDGILIMRDASAILLGCTAPNLSALEEAIEIYPNDMKKIAIFTHNTKE